MPYNIAVILGATASGKTELACHLAKKIGGEIISADSRQVYKKMDIGTGKDLDEYIIDEQSIPYHLIDIKDPGYKYNIAEFQNDFIQVFNTITEHDKFPILCGGSGLYIETALNGNSFLGIPSDEELWQRLKRVSENELNREYLKLPAAIKNKLNALTAQRKIRAIEIANFLVDNPNWKPKKMPELNPLLIGLVSDRDIRRDKISRRLSYRMNHGLIEEVEGLLSNELSHEDLDYYGLEYKWIGKYLRNEIGKRELFEGLSTVIHQFAKRQMTWFRRMEKNGYSIHWIDTADPLPDKLNAVLSIMN